MCSGNVRIRGISRLIPGPSTQVGTVAGISEDIEDIKITRADFMLALDEVHAAFGVSEEELSQVVENGIVHFSREIDVSWRRFAVGRFTAIPLNSCAPCRTDYSPRW